MNDAPGPASGKASNPATPRADYQPPHAPRPLRKPSPLPWALLLFLVVLLALAFVSCDTRDGLPADPRAYDVRSGSLQHVDGRYYFLWAAQDGELHQADARDVKLQQDEQTYLEVQSRSQSILHLRPEEQVQTVRSGIQKPSTSKPNAPAPKNGAGRSGPRK